MLVDGFDTRLLPRSFPCGLRVFMRVCAYICICNMIHTQIGRQEKNGQIEPVQRVRRRAHMTMMHS